MKGTGKCSGAVMQIVLFSQLLTSSLWFQHQQWPPSATLSPLSLSSLSSSATSIPFSHLSCFFSHFPSCLYMSLLPSSSPSLLYSRSIYPPQSQRSSCCIYLHVVEIEKQEHFGGECEWLRSLPLNRHSQGSRLENMTGVGSAFEVLDEFWRAP